jgi:1-acyl-sn-glycerol-3-phosphate acyltransferase
MNDKKRKSDSPPSAPKVPQPEASERLLQAEGADVPQRSVRLGRRRRSRAGRAKKPRTKAAPAMGPVDPMRDRKPDANRKLHVDRRGDRKFDVDRRSDRKLDVDRTGDRRLDVEHPADRDPDVLRPNDPNIAARIRELEERLDRMIDAHARDRDAADDHDPVPSAGRVEPAPASANAPTAPDSGALSERELLSTDFYRRQWGRLGLRSRAEEVDEFGYDPVYEKRFLPFFEFLYERYFRVETHGMDRVPSQGRCLLVANHSGTLPVDGMMLRLAVRREHSQHRDVRWLAEDAIFHFPFLGSFTNRLGAVRACPENAERLLNRDALVAVFPEGMKGIGKLFRDRYKLQRFGRGGFLKLSLRTRAPVVPVAIIGSEETNPMVARVEYLTRVFGIPYLPVTPTFPLLGPLGLLPAPTKWKMYFGEPIDLQNYGAQSAEDEVLVGRLAELVRGEIQSMLDRALAERRSVWFG